MSDSYDSHSDPSSSSDDSDNRKHRHSSDSSDDLRNRYRHHCSGTHHRSSSKNSNGNGDYHHGHGHGHGHGYGLKPVAAPAVGGLTKLKHHHGGIPSDKRHHAADKTKTLTKAAAVKAATNQIEKRREKDARAISDSEYRERRRRRNRYYNSDSDYSDSSSSGEDSEDSSDDNDSNPSAGKGDMSVSSGGYHKRHKTKLEKKVDEILDAFGLLHIKNDPSRHQFSSPDPEKYAKQKQALQAAVTAAAIEAWRSHSKPGGFNLQKVIRIVAAAIAAGGVDVLVDSRPGHDNIRDIAEAVVGGLATSKALGGRITHRREGGAQGKMIDGFIALAASKMVKTPKPGEMERRKGAHQSRSRSLEPTSRSAHKKHQSRNNGSGRR